MPWHLRKASFNSSFLAFSYAFLCFLMLSFFWKYPIHQHRFVSDGEHQLFDRWYFSAGLRSSCCKQTFARSSALNDTWHPSLQHHSLTLSKLPNQSKCRNRGRVCCCVAWITDSILWFSNKNELVLNDGAGQLYPVVTSSYSLSDLSNQRILGKALYKLGCWELSLIPDGNEWKALESRFEKKFPVSIFHILLQILTWLW